MFNIPDLWLFATASALLIIAPGQDVVYLITQSIVRGHRAGLYTALGLSSGNLIHTLIVTLGAAAIFQSSPLAFNLLKYMGAAYLFYLAFKTLQHRNAPLVFNASNHTAKNSNAYFKRGIIMNILNPKVSLFFLAFLPQFTSPNSDNITLQLLFLGVLFTILTTVIFSAMAYTSASISHYLRDNPYTSRVINWISAVVFILLGLRLMLLQN